MKTITLIDKYDCGHYSLPYEKSVDAYNYRLNTIPFTTLGCIACKHSVVKVISILTITQFRREMKLKDIFNEK